MELFLRRNRCQHTLRLQFGITAEPVRGCVCGMKRSEEMARQCKVPPGMHHPKNTQLWVQFQGPQTHKVFNLCFLS